MLKPDKFYEFAHINPTEMSAVLPESFFNDLRLNNPKSLTLEKASFNSARKASGPKIPIDKQTQ